MSIIFQSTSNPYMELIQRGIDVAKFIDYMDINEQDENGWTALMHAINNSDNKNIITLLRNGANPDIQSNEGITALMLAANHNILAMEPLLKHGANPNLIDSEGNSAIEHINTKKDIYPYLLLLEYGANTNLDSILRRAIAYNIDIVEPLLEAGANPNTKSKYGITAFDLALDNPRFLELLIRKFKVPKKLRKNPKVQKIIEKIEKERIELIRAFENYVGGQPYTDPLKYVTTFYFGNNRKSKRKSKKKSKRKLNL